MVLRTVLPEHHLSEALKDLVKLVTGLIATLAALVLGLLIASMKNAYDAVNEGFRVAAIRPAHESAIRALLPHCVVVSALIPGSQLPREFAARRNSLREFIALYTAIPAFTRRTPRRIGRRGRGAFSKAFRKRFPEVVGVEFARFMAAIIGTGSKSSIRESR